MGGIFWASLIILVAVLMVLALKYHLLRKELQRLTAVYEEFDLQSNRRLHLKYGDKALENFVAVINEQQEQYLELYGEMLRTDRGLKEGITNISHDLRTPLTAVLGFIRLLKREMGHEYLDIIERRSDSLEALIEELFAFSKMESQKFQVQLQDIDLTELVSSVISEFYEEIVESGFTPNIEIVEEPIWIAGEELGLRRILGNLIKNALTHGVSEIGISLALDQKNVLVTVSNKVQNFTADMDKLFDRFYSPTPNGSGLGLYIARQLALEMNGELRARLAGDVILFELEFKSGN